MSREIFRNLLNQYITGELTSDEKAQLNEMINQQKYNDALEEFVREIMLSDNYDDIESPVIRAKIHAYLDRHMSEEKAPVTAISFPRHKIWYQVAAAVIFLMLGVGTYLWFNNSTSSEIATTNDNIILKQDIPPGTHGATLTLADGSKIILDSVDNGMLASQGTTKLVKQNNGQLVYETNNPGKEALYNVLSTDRGKQFQVTLSDGTRIWLNSVSSLRYPTTFTGKERRIEVTGEAYFEVAHKSAMPFLVKKSNGDVTIHVLGTHFNIKAYDDEADMKTTLLEGRVKITYGNNSNVLKPGQQAILNNVIGQVQVIENADIDEAVAWKNGLFQFNNANIETVMKQVERWYDVEVIYADQKPNGHYRGKISRNVNASEMLKILEVSGVHFRIEGKKIIVKN